MASQTLPYMPDSGSIGGLKLSKIPSSSSMTEMHRSRKLRLLIAANGPKEVAFAQAIAVRLSKEPKVTTRAIVDEMTHRLAQEIVVLQNRSVRRPAGSGSDAGGGSGSESIDALQLQAFELVEWADLLVLAPLDADNLAKMMSGVADTLLLEVLRGWDASKRILLVPGMTIHMWENPVTKRQMSKLHRKWHWIRVMPPILWHYDDHCHRRRVVEWAAFNDVVSIVKNQADLLALGHDVDVGVGSASGTGNSLAGKAKSVLPPEIWTIIFEYVNDWELARAMNVFTALEMPTHQGWRLDPKDPADAVQVFTHELEWLLLTTNTPAICQKLAAAPPGFHDLSALAIKLIFKFSLTGVLSYIETNCPHLFKCFDGKTIPTKASAAYARTDILAWWARSPSFLEKQYDAEALDGASKMGYVHVLDWWLRSSLPLKYTERALEQASARGHIAVLEWWRDAAQQQQQHDPPLVVLRPGRSLLAAVQGGQLGAMRWWVETSGSSGVLLQHAAAGDGLQEQLVCKTASRWGQVGALELWRGLRGDGGITFDAEVLKEPTLHSHIAVLEWWKRYAHGELPGMGGRRAKRVEYRTMDIEEALDDSFGDQSAVRRWWAQNGLNLGLGTSEWMKPRYL